MERQERAAGGTQQQQRTRAATTTTTTKWAGIGVPLGAAHDAPIPVEWCGGERAAPSDLLECREVAAVLPHIHRDTNNSSKPDRMIIANKSHEESHYFTASIAWSDRILMRSRPHARFACTIACHAISKSNPWQSLPRIAHCSPEMGRFR